MAFNPIKEEKGGKKLENVVWTTKILEQAVAGLEQGKRLTINPFLDNNIQLLKPDITFKRTKEEIAEWKKCRDDVVYFANKYAQLMTPQGIRHITLRDYQVEYLRHLQENRLSIMLSCRQSGKTTTSGIFMLWYLLFNIDKQAMVLANKRGTAADILRKTKDIFLPLPYFLKPGVTVWNEGRIAFDNGCSCKIDATTLKSAIGNTSHCVLWDEAAHTPPNIQESFYNNLFPTITAGRARFMITSTQNGPELFCRLYTAAVNGENEYKPFKVDWWQVPEWDDVKQCFVKRDETWMKLQIGNLGSAEAFNEQFGTEFMSATNSLVSNRIITEKSLTSRRFVVKDMPGVYGNSYFFWDPDYDLDNLRRDYFVFTTDISEGINGDFTVQMINRLKTIDELGNTITETVGYFRTNDKDDKECCDILYNFYTTYMSPEHYLISIERNLYGELWVTNFKKKIDELMPHNLDMDRFIKFYNESMTRYVNGVRMSSKSKPKACKLFKAAFERNYIINPDIGFLAELRNFSDKNGNGSYKALFGHDDMVMSQIQLVLAQESLQYSHLLDSFRERNDLEDPGINFYEDICDIQGYSYSRYRDINYTNYQAGATMYDF